MYKHKVLFSAHNLHTSNTQTQTQPFQFNIIQVSMHQQNGGNIAKMLAKIAYLLKKIKTKINKLFQSYIFHSNSFTRFIENKMHMKH